MAYTAHNQLQLRQHTAKPLSTGYDMYGHHHCNVNMRIYCNRAQCDSLRTVNSNGYESIVV